MTLTTNSLSYLVDEIVSSVAFGYHYEVPMVMPLLYRVMPSARRRERSASVGELTYFTEKTVNQAPDTDTMTQQYEKTLVHTAYGKQIPVERELLDDNEWLDLDMIGEQLGTKAAETIELKAAQLFHDAFAGATYLAEDGLSICNGAHVNSDSGNSQSNSGTTAFSVAAVKSTRTLMRKFKNYRGDLMSVRPDSLLVPEDLESDMWEVLNSMGRPDTTNNAENFWRGSFRGIVWDFLSTGVSGGDANNWFMMDSRITQRNLMWYQRVPLEIFGDGNILTGTKTIGAYFRCSHGCKDWRGIYGHAVS